MNVNRNTSSSDEEDVENEGADHLIPEPDTPDIPPYQLPGRKIPFVIWGVIKLCGIFHERRLVTDRRCYHCQVRNAFRKSRALGRTVDAFERVMQDEIPDFSGQNYYMQDGDTSLGVQTSPIGSPAANHAVQKEGCPFCDCYWWDYYGSVQEYTDEDIGVGRWSHAGSWLLSVLITLGALMVIFYDAFYYLGSLWGQQRQLIHVISYGTFMGNLVLYPGLNLMCKMRIITQHRVSQLSWSTALSGRYIVKRLQYLNIQQRGTPGKLFLLIGTTCTIFHTIYRGAFYLILCGRFSWHSGISVVCGSVILGMFVGFQYLVYLMRLSFRQHFQLVESFIGRQQGDLDKCRHVLGSAFQDYNCYRKLVSVYMTLFIPTLTWAVTTHVTWQYFLRSQRNSNSTSVAVRWVANNETLPDYVGIETRINILIWEEILMFFGLSMWAVGGLDASYMWKRFRLRLLMVRRESRTNFWRKMARFLDLLYERYDGINLTMVFSLIGFFMALQFGNHQMTTLVIQEPNCEFTAAQLMPP